MLGIWLWACLLALAIFGSQSFAYDIPFQSDDSVAQEIKENKAKIDSLQKTLGAVARQLMLQQLFVEERIRSEGHSGLKQVRLNAVGTRPYIGYSHTGHAVASIHDHANNMRTIGMGEYIAVMNGVEFRTRHNDYRLFQPHRTSSKYHALEPIPFPDVPPEVTSKPNVNEQIVEMREWFKAWRDQDHTKRDYRKYFRPVICYLEGSWINGDTKGDIEEPFPSDRHFVDAKNWFDLQEKIRFTSYSGRKSNFENYAFLPTTIMNMNHGTTPVFVQWNYRILCHPLKDHLPTNRFRVVDDFAARMRGRLTMENLKWLRQARFQLNPRDTDTWTTYEIQHRHSLLDKLMEQIPGKDNYQGNLTDDAFDLPAMKIDSTKGEWVNTGYYHRMFKVTARGAMGLSTRQRGFSDENLFMAMTSQPKIAGMGFDDCKKVRGKEVCKRFDHKWSYAIPLEIIYLTPLAKWNPYNIQYKGWPGSSEGRTVLQGSRNGATEKTAYNGTNEILYYMTPAAFFNGDANGKDPADTTKSAVWVLDKSGTPRRMSASGVRILMPSIPGVGILRQRYPIMPVHGEGSSVWKEVSALTDVLMQSQKYLGLYRQSINTKPLPTIHPAEKLELQVRVSTRKDIAPHNHIIPLEEYQVADLLKGADITVTTGKGSSHQHEVVIRYHKQNRFYYIVKCDGQYTKWPYRCWDKHTAMLDIIKA